MTTTRRLEVKMQRPNAIFESWLEKWLEDAERKGNRSKYKLREALDALRMYPLPLSSGRECAILRGFGSTLCNLIDEEMRLQASKATTINLNSSMYEQDVQQVVETVKKARSKNSAQAKEKAPKLTKKQQKAIEEEEQRVKQVTMSAGSFRIVLIVDTQETSGKNKRTLDQTRGYLESLHVEYEVRRLTVGDFLWIARNADGDELVLPYIVERKRMDDLASSIRDGRFSEQKHRLKQSGIQHVIYLVEDYGDNEHLGLPLENLQQALSNTLIQSNFAIQRTENHRRSMMYLQGMSQMLIRLYKDKVLLSCDKEDLQPSNPTQRMVGLLKFKSLYEDSARNALLTVREVFVQQLLQLHSLSLEKSLAIVELYSTPRCLMDAYDNCGSITEARNLLASIRCGQLERPLGEKISHTIYDFYRSVF
ncbi:crossover junction endonuclease MUS81 [Stomoxys calcitrans]|uniref:Crossover junction endonuclease MUS81 n=1 Tax=Stomoxys calcitrans TaxID=35570 RepID=A0A1I8Q2M6_STOCA|nr:crossover junction endonuclease MUS81 [Stomoxys calcitrans]